MERVEKGFLKGRRRSEKGYLLPGRKIYDDLLIEPSIKDWSRRYQSEATRDSYLRNLKEFLDLSKLTPDEFLKLDKKRARDSVWELAKTFIDKEQYTKAKIFVAAMKSFYYHHNEEKLPFDSRVGGRHYIPDVSKKVDYEHIPDKEEIYKMLDSSVVTKRDDYLRDRAILLVLFFSGIRVNALCHLLFSHVRNQLYPEIRRFREKISVRLKITENIDTKLRNKRIKYYWTFLGPEAALALREYCDKVHVNSSDETPLFLTENRKGIDKTVAEHTIKKLTKRAGLDPKSVWVHCIRKSFRKILNKSDMDEDTKEATYGHRLPGSRGNYWDRHDLDEIEEKYQCCNFHRTKEEIDIKRIEDRIREEMEEKIGCMEKKWKEERKWFMKDGDRQFKERVEAQRRIKELEQRLKELEESLKERGKSANPGNPNNCHQRKLIKEQELPDYPKWEIETTLPSGLVSIRKTSS